MKKSIVLLFILYLVCFLSSCGASTSGSSQMVAKVNDTEIVCSDGQLANYLKENTKLVHVAKSGLITMAFSGDRPESATVEDVLLDDNGNAQTGNDAVTIQTIPVKDGQGTYRLTEKLCALTSSNSEDYGKGKGIRGLQVSYEAGGKQYTSTFAVSTDI